MRTKAVEDTDLDHQGQEGRLRPLEVVDPAAVGHEAVGSNHGQEVLDDPFDRLKPLSQFRLACSSSGVAIMVPD